MSTSKITLFSAGIAVGTFVKDRTTRSWSKISSVSLENKKLKLVSAGIVHVRGGVDVAMRVKTVYLIPADASKFHKLEEGKIYVYVDDNCDFMFVTQDSSKGKEYSLRWNAAFS